eukprot:1690568-Rhodomonas_salina.1
MDYEFFIQAAEALILVNQLLCQPSSTGGSSTDPNCMDSWGWTPLYDALRGRKRTLLLCRCTLEL